MIVSRLRTEYGVTAEIEPAPYTAARWLVNPAQPTPSGVSTTVVEDRRGVRVLLFESEWQLNYFERQHPDVLLQAESPVAPPMFNRSGS